MTTDDKIIDEKLQFEINREAAKVSASSSTKIDKHKYLTAEKILLPNQKKVTELAKFT